MKILVVSLSSRGVMGLAAASFINTLALDHKIKVICGKMFPINEVKTGVDFSQYNLEGQGIFDLLKVHLYFPFIQNIKEFKPDLIIFYSSHLYNLLIIFFALIIKVKTTFVFHDPDERTKYNYFSKQYLFNSAMKVHNILLLWLSNKILITYKDAESLVKKKYGIKPIKIVSIPLIPFTELATWRSNTQSSSKKFDVVFFGRVDKYKDYDTFFKSIEHIISNGKPLSVLLVIQGDDSVIEKYCTTRLRKHITVINNFLPETEFETLVSSSRVAVFPYIGATGSHGPSVAFSLGVPIIASKVGCFSEYINEFGIGICVEPQNVKALALAIIKLLEMPISGDDIKLKFMQGSSMAKKRLHDIIGNLDPKPLVNK